MKKIFLIIIFFSTLAIPQELNCTVTVNTEGLPVVNREILKNFASVIQNYMNSTKFTDEEWEGDKILCSMDIYFTGATSETDYNAQVVVVSQRPIYKSTDNSPVLQINDGQWYFTYQKNQPLIHNPGTFDPMVSFLDYYADVIIGMDMDTWQKMAGTPYFNQAYTIVNFGSSSQYSQGWTKTTGTYNRKSFVEDLLNEKYRPLREAIYDYYYGIDIFNQNKKVGQQKIVKLIETLDAMKNKLDINSIFVKVFFDAKSGEIIDRLKDYQDKSIFNILKKVDPAHMAKYDEAMSG
jgi:Domain of unknown function (DUF4835)